jgi:chromosome transmission fidelity protein 18
MEAMGDISSPCLPPTSDPALYGTLEFSGQNFLVVPSSAFSDDLEALQLVHEEKVAENNKAGIVIQHRAWATGEAFRSDQDYSQGMEPYFLK